MRGHQHQPSPVRRPGCRRGPAAGRSNAVLPPAAASTASTTVLPTSSTRCRSTCSRSRASTARWVGARCRSATRPDQPTVGLLGERRGQVAGAQPGLQVDQRDPPPERDQPADQRRGGVALHDDTGRAVRGEDPVECRGELRDQLDLLAGAPVELEAHVRALVECGQGLRDHGGVLAGGHQDRVHAAAGAQRGGQRRHLYRLRPGADDDVNSGQGHGSVILGSAGGWPGSSVFARLFRTWTSRRPGRPPWRPDRAVASSVWRRSWWRCRLAGSCPAPTDGDWRNGWSSTGIVGRWVRHRRHPAAGSAVTAEWSWSQRRNGCRQRPGRARAGLRIRPTGGVDRRRCGSAARSDVRSTTRVRRASVASGSDRATLDAPNGLSPNESVVAATATLPAPTVRAIAVIALAVMMRDSVLAAARLHRPRGSGAVPARAEAMNARRAASSPRNSSYRPGPAATVRMCRSGSGPGPPSRIRPAAARDSRAALRWPCRTARKGVAGLCHSMDHSLSCG